MSTRVVSVKPAGLGERVVGPGGFESPLQLKYFLILCFQMASVYSLMSVYLHQKSFLLIQGGLGMRGFLSKGEAKDLRKLQGLIIYKEERC